MAELGTVPPQTRRSLRTATSCSPARDRGTKRGSQRQKPAPNGSHLRPGRPQLPGNRRRHGAAPASLRRSAPPQRAVPVGWRTAAARRALGGGELSVFRRARDLGCTEAWGWLQGKGRAAQERAEQTLRQKRYSFISNKSRPSTVGSPLGCKSNMQCLPHSPSPLGEHYGIIPVLFHCSTPGVNKEYLVISGGWDLLGHPQTCHLNASLTSYYSVKD